MKTRRFFHLFSKGCRFLEICNLICNLHLDQTTRQSHRPFRECRPFETPRRQPGPTRIKIHLPVAAREIRVAAHDRGIYRGRAAAAATALLVTSWILYSMFQFTGQASSMIGLQTFAFQSWAAFIFACGALTATCDSISREKRDGTLGLLFLTHLKGRDVILGKLISAMSLFVAAAIATLPILTLPV